MQSITHVSHLLQRRKQGGVALVVCMLILLILSLLGISAMRMSMSQAMVTTGSQASELSFQAAATGLNQAIGAANNDLLTRAILPEMGQDAIVVCVKASEGAVAGECGEEDFVDGRGIMKSKVTVENMANIDDPKHEYAKRMLAAVARFGAVPEVVIEGFVFESEGSVEAVDVGVTHVQETIFPHL